MDFKVIITQAAVNDLEEIVDYISRNDPRAAQRVANDFVSRAGVRRLVRHPYLIIYRIDEAAKAVMVLRFWHGARNPKSLRLE